MASPSSPDPPPAPGRPRGGRHRNGRPHRSRSRPAPRSARLAGVRVCRTVEERARLKTLAARLGLTVAAYVRRAVFGRPMARAVPALNREAWARLGALGADLNQCVRAIDQGRATGADRRLLQQLARELAAVRRALQGLPGEGKGGGAGEAETEGEDVPEDP